MDPKLPDISKDPACETLKDLIEKVNAVIVMRDNNIQLIRKIADSVDESCYKAYASKVGGATAAIPLEVCLAL